MQKTICFIVCLIIVLAITSCTSKNPSDSHGITLTEEAQLAALWLSDESFVPEVLALNIQEKLALMREEYSNEIPQVNIEFAFPAVPKMLSITMGQQALQELKAGNYHEWDGLNRKYGIDSIIIRNEYFGWVRLTFKAHVNPYTIAPEYSGLRGIAGASANGYAGDWPNTYPWIVDDELVFLVREAWGDCPSGCIHSKFWYFKSNGDHIDFIGGYEPGHELPLWWDEIAPALEKYRHFWVVPE